METVYIEATLARLLYLYTTTSRHNTTNQSSTHDQKKNNSHKSMMWLRQIAQLSTTISANKQESVVDRAMVLCRATHPKTTAPRHSTVKTVKSIMWDREGGMGHIILK